MRKFKPMTFFVGINQQEQLRVLSAATLSPNASKIPDMSISALLRDAITQYVQDLEELEDSITYGGAVGRARLRAETANIERAIKADR